MSIRNLTWGVVFATLPLAALAQGDYQAAIDQERLNSAADEHDAWLSYGRTYAEQRYSPLDQINADTVDQLSLSWYADMTTSRGQEATPLVVDGALYISTAWSLVHAFDVRTGQHLWTYDPQVDPAKGRDACCDVVNRGVAAWDGKIFVGTLDGRLVALDSASGDVLWEEVTVDQDLPYTITGAPRVIKGMVVIGNGGAEYGVRGYVTAYDADTGEQAWRFYTVPGNPADGFENDLMANAAQTWTGQWWNLGGGGTVWDAMAYDPDLDLLYLGVGNGSPWNQALRSPEGGDNLFLSSIVAIDPDDGSYAWHYQTVPGETWDYTATQHIMLADLEIDGEQRRVVMQAPKNGFFYVLDRETGEFISANNYVPVNWATHIDPDSGRPVETLDARYDETLAAKTIVPSALGSHNWHPMSFSPETSLVYFPAKHQSGTYRVATDFESQPMGFNTGNNTWDPIEELIPLPEELRPTALGYLLAWDPVAQEEAWRVDLPTLENGGVLSTAGGLVFQGNSAGEIVAYHDATGERLWSAPTQTGVLAPPVSFAIDGEQYIAVVAGWGGVAANVLGPVVNADGRQRNVSRVLAFKLDATASLPEPAASPPRPEPPGDFGTDAQIAEGARHYGRYCYMCHGAYAMSGGALPDLRYSAMTDSDAAFAAVVLEGALEDRGMASFAPVLDAEEVEAIRAFIARRANEI